MKSFIYFKSRLRIIGTLLVLSSFLFTSNPMIAQQGGVSRYVYDENGRLHAVIAPNNEAAIYEYDPAGNFTRIRRPGPNSLEIIDLAPKKGLPGTLVSFWGVGFGSSPPTVSFNGATARVVQSSPSFLIAEVPSNGITGLVTITTTQGSTSSPVPFTVKGNLHILGDNVMTTNNNTLSYTVPPGNNRMLAVIASHADSAGLNFTGVTFGSQPMTLAGFLGDGALAMDSIWYRALGNSSTATTATVTATPPAGEEPTTFLAAQAFENVDQDTPMNNVQSEQKPSGTNIGSTLNVASATNNLVLDVFDIFLISPSANVTRTPGTGQTVLHLANIVISKPPSTYSGLGCYTTSLKAGAPSVTMSWTSNGTGMIHVAVNINAVGFAANSTLPEQRNRKSILGDSITSTKAMTKSQR